MKLLTDLDYLAFTGRQESQFLVNPSELVDKVKKRFSAGEGVLGDRLPWSKTHSYVGLRMGEVSLWAGINGHGKSSLLTQVCAWNLSQNKWLLASMEMLPERTMEKMTQQVAGCIPSNGFIERFAAWSDDKLWIYDQTESVKSERIIAMIYYAATELKIKHIVIDSLMKCGIRKDDLNSQVAFVDQLCWIAKTAYCHIHLVHHIRKGEKESRVPGKFDVRGAGEVTDLVDNVFIIHRNKAAEAKVRRGEPIDQDEPNCRLIVDKQRHGEWEGMFNLWFHGSSKQFVPRPENRSMGFHFDY